MTDITQVDFYATEYHDLGLRPDTWELPPDIDTDAGASRFALDKIAARMGVPRGLISLADESEYCDVLYTPEVGADPVIAGQVAFVWSPSS